MKVKFEFELKGTTCRGCPFLKYLDNWDVFVCYAEGNRRNDSFANYPDGIKERPDWCPLKAVEE